MKPANVMNADKTVQEKTTVENVTRLQEVKCSKDSVLSVSIPINANRIMIGTKNTYLGSDVLKIIIKFHYGLAGMPVLISLMRTNKDFKKLVLDVLGTPPHFINLQLIQPVPNHSPFNLEQEWLNQSIVDKVKFLYDYNVSISKNDEFKWFNSIVRNYFKDPIAAPKGKQLPKNRYDFLNDTIDDNKKIKKKDVVQAIKNLLRIIWDNTLDHHGKELGEYGLPTNMSSPEIRNFIRQHIFQNEPLSRLKHFSKFHFQALALGLTVNQIQNVSDQIPIAELLKKHNKEAEFSKLSFGYTLQNDIRREKIMNAIEVRDLPDDLHIDYLVPNQFTEKCGTVCQEISEAFVTVAQCLAVCICSAPILITEALRSRNPDNECLHGISATTSFNHNKDTARLCCCKFCDTDERSVLRWLKSLTPEELFEGSPLQKLMNEHKQHIARTQQIARQQSAVSIPITQSTTVTAHPPSAPKKPILMQYNTLSVQVPIPSVSIGITNSPTVTAGRRMTRA